MYCSREIESASVLRLRMPMSRPTPVQVAPRNHEPRVFIDANDAREVYGLIADHGLMGWAKATRGRRHPLQAEHRVRSSPCEESLSTVFRDALPALVACRALSGDTAGKNHHACGSGGLRKPHRQTAGRLPASLVGWKRGSGHPQSTLCFLMQQVENGEDEPARLSKLVDESGSGELGLWRPRRSRQWAAGRNGSMQTFECERQALTC